jgi:hypothetical protein
MAPSGTIPRRGDGLREIDELLVIPAKAGIQTAAEFTVSWIPARASLVRNDGLPTSSRLKNRLHKK